MALSSAQILFMLCRVHLHIFYTALGLNFEALAVRVRLAEFTFTFLYSAWAHFCIAGGQGQTWWGTMFISASAAHQEPRVGARAGIDLWLSGFQVWLPARRFVREAIEKRKSVDVSGEIILLETICPWKEHLYELEEEMGIKKPLKYCIYEVCPFVVLNIT